jgi:uroporphyrinogen-III synthase
MMPMSDEAPTERARRAPAILVTREDPGPVCEAVRTAGGEPVDLALLVTRWLPFEVPGGRHLDDYDWIAFTSARALDALARRAVRDAWNWPPRARAAAVGDRTAHELQARGWMPECVSTGTGARGLVKALQARVGAGERLLFPCSTLAESTLPDGMRAAGAVVDVVHVYSTETVWERNPERKTEIAARLRNALREGCVPTCASPSAVRALVEAAEAAGVASQLRQMPLVVLGPTTANAARNLSLDPIDSGGKNVTSMARRAVEVARTRSAS